MATSTWEKYTVKMDEITSIIKINDGILIHGHGPDVSSTITLHTKDVENLWFSIKRAQNKEMLRTLREDRIERIARGRLC